MRLKQSGPRRPGGTVAGEIRIRRNHTTTTVGVNGSSLAGLAVEFAGQNLEAERCLLAAGWLDPIGLHDAGFRAGLRGWHFTLPEHSFLYCAVCLSAADGIKLTVADTARIARAVGVALTEDDIFDIVLCTDAMPHELDSLAETVVDFAEQRAAAWDHFEGYRDIITSSVIPARKVTQLVTATRFPVRRLSA